MHFIKQSWRSKSRYCHQEGESKEGIKENLGSRKEFVNFVAVEATGVQIIYKLSLELKVHSYI